MKRRPCAYDANWPGNRYQALMMQFAIVRQGNEQVLAELRAVRDGAFRDLLCSARSSAPAVDAGTPWPGRSPAHHRREPSGESGGSAVRQPPSSRTGCARLAKQRDGGPTRPLPRAPDAAIGRPVHARQPQ
jgi:hypothetical protein